MKKIKMKEHLLDIVMWGIMQIYFVFPWIRLDGKWCGIYQYFFRGLQTKEIFQLYIDAFVPEEALKFLTQNTKILANLFWVDTGILIGLQVISFLYLIWRFRSERFQASFLVVQWMIGLAGCLAVWMMESGDEGIWEANAMGVKTPVSASMNIYLGAYLVLMMIWLFAAALKNQKSEIEAYQKKEKEFKKERKRRLYFPGKYSRLYYKVLWKNLKYRKRDWMLLDVTGIIATITIFVGFGIYQIFSESYGENHGLLGPGLAETTKDFLIITTLIMLFMLTSVLIFYRRKRMADRGLYRLLGIRSKSLRKAWIGELIVCFVTAVVIGLIMGSGILYCIRLGLEQGIPEIEKLGGCGVSAYLGTFLLMLIISLFAIGFSHEVQGSKESADVRGLAIGKERMPGRGRLLISVALCIPAIYAVIRYGQRRSAENIVVLSLFLICIYGILYQVGAIYLDDEKRHRNHYLKRLPFSHMIAYRYQTTIRYFVLFIVIQVCTLFFFTMKFVSNQIATPAEELYPYDYVYLANSGDTEFFRRLEQECSVKISELPMVRATTVDNTERLERPGMIPAQQGQNIGISETTYRKLKKMAGESYQEDLGLDEDGKKIYIVYQQDQGVKAKPIDWYMMEKLPYVHIGQPLLRYNAFQYQKFYQRREIAGEERESLIGAFRQGKYENLIVFSDAYFNKVKDNWKTEDAYTGVKIKEEKAEETKNIKEGPNRLVLITMLDLSKENQKKADAFVKEFREKHAYDESFDPMVKSVYDKETSIHQREMERLMEEIVSAFVLIVLMLIDMLMLYMKVEMELPEMKLRYQFMKRIGMRRKERLKAESLEVSRFFWIPLLITMPVIILYTVVVFVLRIFSTTDIVHYMGGALVVWGCCLFLQFLNMKWLQRKVRKKVEVFIDER